jgi:hypothetical protein
MLTPKNGTGKGLTYGPSLVTKYHSARKNVLREFDKGCLRSTMRHHSAKGQFALLMGSFRECVVTWPDVRKERVDGVYETDIGVGALIWIFTTCGRLRSSLLDHEPCGRLRSSLELVIGSIRFGKI